MHLLFSGDIGPGDQAFHPDPEAPSGVDHLILESTYGDRERAQVTEIERRELLRKEVAAALERGGNLLIPAFAVERTQEILYDLDILFDTGQLPVVEVFLDSPLAIKATEVFRTHLHDINHAGTPHPFRRANLHPTETVEESKRLARLNGGAIIMAGSGMCTAGRIRHHLKNNLWRPEATVLMVGYQAPGTLGRLLLEGRKHVRIHGKEIAVRATIRSIEAFSGHADRAGLIDWAKARLPVRGSVFLTHGEDPARATLKAALAREGLDESAIRLPALDSTVTLERTGVAGERTEAPRVPAEVLADIDWHNDYAETVLSLSDTLDKLPDDAARRALLKRIDKAMAAAEAEAG
jgi:metallo-beta-lactamase family protein